MPYHTLRILLASSLMPNRKTVKNGKTQGIWSKQLVKQLEIHTHHRMISMKTDKCTVNFEQFRTPSRCTRRRARLENRKIDLTNG